jgi:hypothetical protein
MNKRIIIVLTAMLLLPVTLRAEMLDKMVSPVRTQKILRNGQILILRGGKTYTILGL